MVTFSVADLIFVTCDAFACDFESYELACDAFSFLFLVVSAVDEVVAVDELGDPAETSLDR